MSKNRDVNVQNETQKSLFQNVPVGSWMTVSGFRHTQDRMGQTPAVDGVADVDGAGPSALPLDLEIGGPVEKGMP